MATENEGHDIIQECVPAGLAEYCIQAESVAGELHLTVAPENLLAACRQLHDDAALAFDYPADLTVRDTGEEFVMWIRLHSMSRNATAIVHVTLPREAPLVDSVTCIWPGFNWYERECFDLFGIEFVGHPDAGDPLRMRILMPEDWVGHPFRRDYEPVFSGDPFFGPQELN